MNGQTTITRRMTPDEAERVSSFVRKVFGAFVAPHYSPEGIQEFYRYIDPELLARRIQSDHVVWVTESNDQLVGMIEMRNLSHISLLFVAGEAQRGGIARRLLQEALEWNNRNGRDLREVTVHSTPNAVEAYERLGFHAEGPEQNIHGLRFVPMK